MSQRIVAADAAGCVAVGVVVACAAAVAASAVDAAVDAADCFVVR